MSNTSAPIKPNQQIAQNNAPKNTPSPNVDIGSIKKQFKNLSLALASKAVGSVKFESGANRDLTTKDNNLDTTIDKNKKDGHNILNRIWLSAKNLAVNNFGKKEDKDVMALEMTSASIYKTLKTSVDKYLTFFKDNGDFDQSRLAEYSKFQKENLSNINDFINVLTSGANKTSLSADEIKSCKNLLLNVFALDGKAEDANLGNIVKKKQEVYDSLNDTQSRQVADHNNLRTQETIGKAIAGGISKIAAIATAPVTLGVGGAFGFGVMESVYRNAVEERTKGKALEKHVGNLRKAINEEVALLDGVDVNNIADPLVDHTDQDNKTPIVDATTGKIKDKGYRGKYNDALLAFRNNPSDAETKKNYIRYAHLFLKSVESIRTLLEDNKEGNLSAATLLSFNKNLRKAQLVVAELMDEQIIPYNPTTMMLIQTKTFRSFASIRDDLASQLDATDKNDKIALETNPVENVRRREAANINKFNAQEKKQIAEGRWGRLGTGALMCSLGNMFAVVNAGVASMADKIEGTQEVLVKSIKDTKDALGFTPDTANPPQGLVGGKPQVIKKFMQLSAQVGKNAQESFDGTTGLEWLSDGIDGILGKQNTIGGVFAKSSETVLKFTDWFRQFNPWNDPSVPGFGQNIFQKGAKGAEAIGDVFTNKAGQEVRNYAFDAAGSLFKKATNIMSGAGSAALWATVGVGALRSRANYSGKALDVAQGGLPPIFNIPPVQPQVERIPEPLKPTGVDIDDLDQLEDETIEQPENFQDFQKGQPILPAAKEVPLLPAGKDKPQEKILTPANPKEKFQDFRKDQPILPAGAEPENVGTATRIEEREELTGTPDRLKLKPGEDVNADPAGKDRAKKKDKTVANDTLIIPPSNNEASSTPKFLSPGDTSKTNPKDSSDLTKTIPNNTPEAGGDRLPSPQNLLPASKGTLQNPDRSATSDFSQSTSEFNGKPDTLKLRPSEANTEQPKSALELRIKQAVKILNKKLTFEALVDPANPNIIDKDKAFDLFSTIIKQSPERKLDFDVVSTILARFSKELAKNPKLTLEQQISILSMIAIDTLELNWTGRYKRINGTAATPSSPELSAESLQINGQSFGEFLQQEKNKALNGANTLPNIPIKKTGQLGTIYESFSRQDAPKVLFQEFKKKEYEQNKLITEFDAFTRIKSLINDLNNPNQSAIEKLVAKNMNDKLKALNIDLTQNKTLTTSQQNRIGKMYLEFLNQEQIN